MQESTKSDLMAEILPNDKMSKFQVGFITATFGEADILTDYIGPYTCDRKYFMRDWKTQLKAFSFLT